MAGTPPSHILIFGATGTIGKYITEALLKAKPAFDHISIFTSANTVKTKGYLLGGWEKEPNISIIVGDITSAEDVAKAYKDNVDTVISCLGRDALQHQKELIRLAEDSGTVKWFFPSEYGTDIEYGPKSPNEKPHQNKLAVRKYIRDNVKKVQVTYLVTGPYFDMWVNKIGDARLGGFDVDKQEAVLIEDGQGKVGFCTMCDVGKCLVAALRHPEQSFGKVLKVQSFVVTPNEVLAEYEKQTDSKWTVSYTPLSKLKEIEATAWEDGKPFATGATLRRIWAEGGTLYEKNDNDVIGLEPGHLDSLETAVSGVLAGETD